MDRWRTVLKELRKSVFALIMFALALVYYFLFSDPTHTNFGDNYWYTPVAMSLIAEGDLDVDEYIMIHKQRVESKGRVYSPDEDYRLILDDGDYHLFYPLGAVISALPLAIPAVVKADGDKNVELSLAQYYTPVLAKCWAAISVFLFALLIAKFTVDKRIIALLSMVFIFASMHSATHGLTYYASNPAMAFLLLALLFSTTKNQLLAGVACGLGYLCRPDVSLFILCIFAWSWMNYKDWKKLLWICVGGAIVAVPFVVSSFIIFETLFPPYYNQSSSLRLSVLPYGLYANFLSPSRGILIFVPCILFSFWGAYLGLKHDRNKYFALVAYMILVITLVSMWPMWWAGWSYGPRTSVLITPVILILLVPVLERLMSIKSLQSKLLLGIMLLMFAWQALLQYRGLAVPAVMAWNNTPNNIDENPERLWHWDNMQSFAR